MRLCFFGKDKHYCLSMTAGIILLLLREGAERR